MSPRVKQFQLLLVKAKDNNFGRNADTSTGSFPDQAVSDATNEPMVSIAMRTLLERCLSSPRVLAWKKTSR